MADPRPHVTLSKSQRDTPSGRELLELLTAISCDGNISRGEMEQLRAWLEIDRGIDFPALPFLYEVIDQIAADGEVSDDELDRLALAIERVLPADVRATAKQRRKETRAAKREHARQQSAASRTADRAAAVAARRQSRPSHRADFMIAGVRFEERREACECLVVGEAVDLEREPDNSHDSNAILVLARHGDELGYVPRADARKMAPLLDKGARVEAVVKKLLETESGYSIPVVIAKLFPSDSRSAIVAARHAAPRTVTTTPRAATQPAPVVATAPSPSLSPQHRTGCFARSIALLVLVAGLAFWL